MPKIITPGNLKMIEGDDRMRAKRCLENIQAILEQWDCGLHPIVTFSPAGNEFGFKVIANERTARGKSN